MVVRPCCTALVNPITNAPCPWAGAALSPLFAECVRLCSLWAQVAAQTPPYVPQFTCRWWPGTAMMLHWGKRKGQGLKDWDGQKGCSQMAQCWARDRFGGSGAPWNNLSPVVRHLPSGVWWQCWAEVFYGTRQEDFPKATTDALMIRTGRVRLMTLKGCFKWTWIYIFK